MATWDLLYTSNRLIESQTASKFSAESRQRLGTQPPRSYHSLFIKSTKNSKCCFVYFVQFVTYLLLQTFSFFRCYFQFLNLKQDSRTTEKKRDILGSRSNNGVRHVSAKIMPSFPNGNMSYRNTENRVTQDYKFAKIASTPMTPLKFIL